MNNSIQALIAAGEGLLAAQRADSERQAAALLTAQRNQLAARLPAATWAALGLDPAQATPVDARTCVLEGAISIPAGKLALKVRNKVGDVHLSGSALELGLRDGVNLNANADENLRRVTLWLAELAEAMQDKAAQVRAARYANVLRDITRESDLDNLAGAQAQLDTPAAGWLTAEERAAVAAATAQRAGALQVQAAERAAVQARRAALTAQAATLAQAYLAERTAYEAACEVWARTETDRLWRPWATWQVRYAPLGYPGRVNADDDAGLIVTILAWPSDTFAANARAGVTAYLDMRFAAGEPVPTVEPDGRLTQIVFGAFLDATPRVFQTPSVTEQLRYHRATCANGWWVNVPPIVTEAVAAAPRPPDPWPQWLQALDYGDECWLRSQHAVSYNALAQTAEPA